MTVDPTRPSRVTRLGLWSAASEVQAPARVLRRGHREHRSTSVQQVGHPVVDVSAAVAEDASLATSRWCRSRDCRRRATLGCPCCCCRCCCRSHWSHCSYLSLFPCPYPCLCRRCWGWAQEGEGPLEDMVVDVVVGTEAAAAMEGALLLRAQSRTWRPVPRPLSGPAQPPRVRGHCGWCGRRGMTTTA
jgi:hypothetical protein